MDRSQWETDFPISKYLQAKAERQGIPLHGIFELTSRCNFQCRMCYIHSEEENRLCRQKELTAEQWIEIGRKARDKGLLFLLLTGGEAMIREDFLEIYKSLVQMGIRVVINSNGSLINEEILSCFKRYPPARINISLYGMSEDTYKGLCGLRAWNRVKNNILKLKAMEIPLRIMMTFTPYNYADMDDVIKFAKENGIIMQGSSYMFPSVRADQNDTGINAGRFAPQKAAQCMVRYQKAVLTEEEFRTMALRYQKDEVLNNKKWQQKGTACLAGNTSFWITWDGKMKACGLMNEPEVNLLDTGFDDAWERIREGASQLCFPSECASCTNREICHVCPAMCQTETGSSDKKPEYVCEMADFIRNEYRSYVSDNME